MNTNIYKSLILVLLFTGCGSGDSTKETLIQDETKDLVTSLPTIPNVPKDTYTVHTPTN